MNRFALLVPLLLPACAGSVNVKGDAEPFGAVRSAIWLHLDPMAEDASVQESLVLTNVPGVCEKVEAFERANNAWWEAGLNLTDAETACADMEGPMTELALAGNELYREGATFLELRLHDDEGPLGAGAYVHDGEPKSFSGGVEYHEADRYAAILDDYDPAGVWEEELCGVGEAFLGDYDVYTDWAVTDGEVVINRFAEGKGVGGRVNATIEDDEGAEAEVVASFSAEWCEIDL